MKLAKCEKASILLLGCKCRLLIEKQAVCIVPFGGKKKKKK